MNLDVAPEHHQLAGEGATDVNPMVGVSGPNVVKSPIPVVTQRHFELVV